MTHPELPCNFYAEKAVLGSILRNREAIIPIASWLKPIHFYAEVNAWIYEAMLACLATRTTPSTLNVVTELKKSDRLESIGGVPYLAKLVDATPSSYDVEKQAHEVERCAVLRSLIQAGANIAAIGYDTARGSEDAVAAAQQELNAVQIGGASDVYQPLRTVVDAYYEKMHRVQAGEYSALGVQTSYRDIDEITGGLHDDELTIVAARPAIGKTSFMLSLAYNVAKRGDCDVLISSLEMSRDQLLVRLLAMETRIDTHRLRLMQLNEDDTQATIEALGRLEDLPIFLSDISAMTAEQIRLATLRHLAKRDRRPLLMIDYLQLMGSTRQYRNRVEDVSELSRALKNLTRELHAPVVALSQLSRAVEGRNSHIPMLSDLRESGSLEQDADNVWFIYREEIYDPESDKKGIAELHISKHRQGPIGVVPMRFDAATTRFDTLTYRTVDGY